ncbi:MAG: heavy metal-binding domain-containing protein [Acidimicrobiia bacterium]|nr:YbjQ family protein [Acidimicrobiia bacterium]NNL12344.1 heavy metal-binding domain-containing protein [Acidimicrobiia bacterium]RZV46606.1 MAG: heavy metal-binding domain-containing protein [Acidimicrobiia bacterium]
MTQEGRVEDFWTTKRRDSPDEDNVRPLLKALAAARRSLSEEQHPTAATAEEGIVVDLRPGSGWDEPAVEFIPGEPEAAGVAKAANAAIAAESVAAAAEAAAAASAAVARAIAAGSAARSTSAAESRPVENATTPPDWIMVEPKTPEEPRVAPPADHPAPEWGDLWRESVQGWVRGEDGTKVWRPIVTTTTAVPNWDIDSNLGMVTGESACALDADRMGVLLESPGGAESLRRELALDRGAAQEAMVREAVARGAHAVIGVNLDYTPVGDCLIVTATGTAVTLRTAR